MLSTQAQFGSLSSPADAAFGVPPNITKNNDIRETDTPNTDRLGCTHNPCMCTSKRERERNETIGTEKLGTKHMVDNRCTAVVEGIGIGIDRSRCHCRFCKVLFFSPISSNPIKRDRRCLPSLPANTHRSTMDGGTQTRRHRHSGRKGIVFPVQESVRVCCC